MVIGDGTDKTPTLLSAICLSFTTEINHLPISRRSVTVLFFPPDEQDIRHRSSPSPKVSLRRRFPKNIRRGYDRDPLETL